jgi:hypothetical protein
VLSEETPLATPVAIAPVSAIAPRPTVGSLLWALRVGSVGLVCLASVWFSRGLDFSGFARAISAASLPLVVAAALLNFVHLGFRAVLLRALLRPVGVVGLGRIFHYNLASTAASNLLPARAGDLLRVWLFKSREQIAASTMFAVSLLEKLFDLAAFLLVAAPIPLLLPALPASVARAIGGGVILAALGTLAAVGLSQWRPAVTEGILARFAHGTHALRGPKNVALALVSVVAAWLVDAGEVWLVLLALGVHLPWGAPLLILVILNVTISVPTTPAQIGAFELGAVAALRLLGVPGGPALAFALLYHFMQVVPVTLFGLDGVRLALRVRREERALETPSGS